jgi:hypothetical protein
MKSISDVTFKTCSDCGFIVPTKLKYKNCPICNGEKWSEDWAGNNEEQTASIKKANTLLHRGITAFRQVL